MDTVFFFFSNTRETQNQADGSNQFPKSYDDYYYVTMGEVLVSVSDVITFYLLREAGA
jgi:hypothetical protein